MTWNWYRHSDEYGDIEFSNKRYPLRLAGNVRTRPATREEILKLEVGEVPDARNY